jgi:hypothetical protein
MQKSYLRAQFVLALALTLAPYAMAGYFPGSHEEDRLV